ncbi:ImmA/IrrE family metallo-endopeptidase [Paenibacillus alvei]|uniref:ImmA/IrrE family metallo-endopeptidase n=1 Tax=Paenibacillus alvei TaxID=44250 RepID=UPI0013DAF28C|nr:ImmA/IrrE family metallo-endopeptidase [Paenibacillus alvei]NEZ41410.1 ImmA/IrrE family metallo-endopeptidase [Paenibacillus alvei]
MLYDRLLSETKANVFEVDMPLTIKGLYADGNIWINKRIETRAEKACVLVEENGHGLKSFGDILDQKESIINRKQELLGRQWGYEYLIPLDSFIRAHQAGVRTRYELAEFLGVTEEFLMASIERYHQRHGLYVDMGDHILHLDPLDITYCFKIVD